MEPRMTPEQADALLATMTDQDFPTAPPELWVSDDEAERLIAAGRNRGGRPSLTGAGQKSPNFTFRLSQTVKDRLAAAAAQQHRRPADLAREAIDQYLAAIA